MKTRADWLAYFFEAYFHQDWRCDHATSVDCVMAFRAGEPADSCQQLRQALQSLQATQADLPQDTINRLGGNFRPEMEGLTMDAWLERAIGLLG
jgi:hypothetical protein